jgi:hypothetical protein
VTLSAPKAVASAGGTDNVVTTVPFNKSCEERLDVISTRTIWKIYTIQSKNKSLNVVGICSIIVQKVNYKYTFELKIYFTVANKVDNNARLTWFSCNMH